MEQKEFTTAFKQERAAWINERFEPKSALDFHIEEITRNGYTVFNKVLEPSRCDQIRLKIDEVYEKQKKDMGGEAALVEIGEHGLARNLLEYDESFIDLIAHPQIFLFIKTLLGEYVSLFQFNGNLNIPDLPATSTPWHRDLTFRHFTTNRPIAVTAIWVIDSFTTENGGITCLPGSHKHDVFPSFEFVEKHQQPLLAESGSVIVLDGLFFHRSGINRSKERRRICQGMYALPFMLQQINVPKNIDEKFSKTPEYRQLLGYNNMQAASVIEWRREKLQNKRKNLQDKMVGY